MVIVTELSLRSRSEKFTSICTIDENFLTGPIGCHSVYTYCTFFFTSEANQYSKQPLGKYCSHVISNTFNFCSQVLASLLIFLSDI